MLCGGRFLAAIAGPIIALPNSGLYGKTHLDELHCAVP